VNYLLRRHSLFFILLFTIQLNAQTVLNQNLKSNQFLKEGIYFFEDKKSEFTLEQIIQQSKFQPVGENGTNFGISPSTFWLKIEIYNKTKENSFRLQIAQSCLDVVDFYYSDGEGNYKVIEGGEHMPFYIREFKDPSFIYQINLPSDSLSTFYFRIQSRDNFQVPLILGTPETVFNSNAIKDFVLGLFAGIMIVMLLYNLFVYISIKDKTYLYYIFYLLTVILTQESIQGYTFQYLWPGIPFLAQWSPFIFSPLVGIASYSFMRIFLNTSVYIPRIDKGFKYFTWAYLIAFAFSLFGQYTLSFNLITLCATTVSMYMFGSALYIYFKGSRPARFFLIAWSIFLFGVTVYALTNFGILPINNFTFYMMPFGAAMEVVLLSLALADRINILKKEKEQSQAEALEISHQNQILIQEQNIILERKVHERTNDLEMANEELIATLNQLKDAQSQLVDSEKMASLGQLTAGIAHEINNPINFVIANIQPLRLDVNELLELINKYEALRNAAEILSQFQVIDAYKKKIDLDYMIKEIEKILKGIDDGAKRTAEIVSGLKNFSRLDENDVKLANINDGIESTLILLRSTIPKEIEVIRELNEVPPIECYPGKLNQVFMNILSNALYALTKKKEGKKQLIIKTYELSDHVFVSIKDTGIGMSKEVKDRIFEPFFTTKDVGEGTGLGMSIVFKIIEVHHARIEVESEVGVGTNFILVLNKKMMISKN